MASKNTENTADGDILIIKELAKHLNYPKDKIDYLIEDAKHGIIAVETLLEYAISVVGDLKRCIKDGQDFVDGSDAKKAVVHTHHHGTKNKMKPTREVVISNIKNKNGILRIMIADTFVDEVYFFKVPNHEIKNKNSINFIFNINGGEPVKFINRSGGTTLSWRLWNMYRVNNFNELCE